jgi:hypothetical protein
MPLATNPSKTLPIWCECDAEIPMESRPTFTCRFLTRHEISAFSDELEAISTLDKQDDARARLSALLAKGITGWRNMTEPGADGKPVPIDFAPDRFDRVLSAQEKWDLAYTMLRAPRLNDEDKKKLSSASPSDTASSAEPVPAEPAPKTTPEKS